jgi:hypothetical protein
MISYLVVGCRVLLGAVFLVSAASKLRTRGDFGQFVAAVARFGLVPAERVRAAAAAVVAVELAIPVLLLVPATVPVGFAVALGLLGVFTAAIGRALRRGVQAPCRCFGVSASPVGRRHLVRNLLLGVVAAAGIAGAFTTVPGDPHVGGVAVATAAGLVLAGLTVVADELVDLFAASTTPGATRGTG